MASPFNIGRRVALLDWTGMTTATGTTLACSPVVDLQGYSGAFVLTGVSVTATGTHLVGRIGTASGSLSDIAGAQVTATCRGLMLEIHKPSGGRYFNAQVRITGGADSGQVWPILVFGIGPESLPTTHNTSFGYKFVNQPGTGTATSS